MATYGKIGEFTESEESWTHYIERLEQYFLANEVDDVGKKQKFGVIKRVDKGWITTVKDLESWRFER